MILNDSNNRRVPKNSGRPNKLRGTDTEKRLSYLEAFCRNVIRFELEKYVKSEPQILIKLQKILTKEGRVLLMVVFQA